MYLQKRDVVREAFCNVVSLLGTKIPHEQWQIGQRDKNEKDHTI